MIPVEATRTSYCEECPINSECAHRDDIKAVKDGYWSPQGTSVPLICPAGWECKYGSNTINNA